MQFTKKAALYGAATLAALGLAAGQMAMAGTTDTVTSLKNANTTLPGSGWFFDTNNNAVPQTPTMGSTIINTNAPVAPGGTFTSTTNGSLDLAIPNGASDHAAALDFLTSPISFTDLSFISFDTSINIGNGGSFAHPDGYTPVFHMYLSNGTTSPYSEEFLWLGSYSNGASFNQSSAWQTIDPLSNGNENLWTLRGSGAGSVSDNTAKSLSALEAELNSDPTSTYSIYGYGVTAESGSGTQGKFNGNTYVDNIHVAGGAYDVTTDFAVAPEPSSVAAFAFTGLGALGLMFKARKRKALDA